MRYVFVDEQNNILKWPVTVSDLTAQPPRLGRKINFSLSRNVADAGFPHYGIHPVTEIERPTVDKRTQAVRRDTSPALVDGVWVSGWAVSARPQADIDAYDAKMRARIKEEAARRILAIAPEWKQRNITARMLELTQVPVANRTGEMLTEINAARAIWAAVRKFASGRMQSRR